VFGLGWGFAGWVLIFRIAPRTVMTVHLTQKSSDSATLVPLALLILGRDVLLGLSAIYYRYISLPPPKTLARYWDFSLPSAEVRPTGISKINTALQLGLVGWTMSSMVWDMGMWGEEGLTGMQ